jgi:hypothetical protein
LLDITESAMVEDRAERLTRLDQATERIDHVLTRLVPTAAASGTQAKAGETRPVLVR